MTLTHRPTASAVRAGTAAAVALALAVCQMTLLYPGLASYDAVFAYTELRHHQVTDWHPPILVRLWSAIEAAGWHGTAPLFLLQLFLFWFGLAILSAQRAASGRVPSAAAMLAIGVFPLVMGTMDTVVKDAQLVGALTCVAGVTAASRLSGRKLPISATVLLAALLAYATLLRVNAFFATVPLAALLFDRRRAAWWGGAALLALAFAAPSANRNLLQAAPGHAERSQMLFDLAGIARNADLPTIPYVAPAEWRVAIAAGCYQPIGWDGFSQSPACVGIWQKLRARPLGRVWLAEILRHPFAYAEHRIRHLNLTLRFVVPRGQPRGTGQGASTPNPYGLGGAPHFAGKLWKQENWLQQRPPGWPIVWVAAGLILLWSAWRMPAGNIRRTVLTILSSALVLEASFLVVSVASDLRYHLWTMIAVGIAGAIMLGEPDRGRAALRVAIGVGVVSAIGYAARAWMAPAWPAWF